MITANRRARATIAFFSPRRLAICIAQALSQDHFVERTSMMWLKNNLRTSQWQTLGILLLVSFAAATFYTIAVSAGWRHSRQNLQGRTFPNPAGPPYALSRRTPDLSQKAALPLSRALSIVFQETPRFAPNRVE
jgi:hypothetical protein